MTQEFTPPRLFQGAHTQTVLASSRFRAWGSNPMDKASQEVILTCQDNVNLQGYLSRQPNGRAKGLVILLHGWEGSSRSSYILAGGRFLYNNGYDIFRLNFRDHGTSHHLNKGIFLSILLDEVVDGVRQAAMFSEGKPVFLAGFSLGGNFALRIASRTAKNPIKNLRQVIAVSPAVNPNRACDAIDRDFLIKWYFLRKWRRSLRMKQEIFPEYRLDTVIQQKNLRDMTQALLDVYETGYTRTRDYFNAYAVTNGWLPPIKVPTLIITAKDDPVIPVKDFPDLNTSPSTEIIVQQHGGHNGFICDLSRVSWVDQKMLEVFDSCAIPLKTASPNKLIC